MKRAPLAPLLNIGMKRKGASCALFLSAPPPRPAADVSPAQTRRGRLYRRPRRRFLAFFVKICYTIQVKAKRARPSL